jgi:hypothetical protein
MKMLLEMGCINLSASVADFLNAIKESCRGRHQPVREEGSARPERQKDIRSPVTSGAAGVVDEE